MLEQSTDPRPVTPPRMRPVGHEVFTDEDGRTVYVGAHIVGCDGLPVHVLRPGRRFLPQANRRSCGPAYRHCKACREAASRS